ncbi:MAG: hypothetical protein EBX52_13525 [Proteobacteria bacterium]|nr:hypothetical protein [Pseudomonadota bacterium]
MRNFKAPLILFEDNPEDISTVLIIIALAALSGSAHAQKCTGNCTALVVSLSKKDVELARIKDILKKNEDYLQKHAAIPPSISVKVHSNLVISKLQIETIQNERTVIFKNIEKQGCKQCQSKNTKDI